MSNFYDDSKFGVLRRKWFGLTVKAGGDAPNGGDFTFGTTDATKQTHVQRWYPKGPIKLKKIGHMVLATLTSSGTDPDQVIGEVITRGASASVAATWNLANATAPWAIASKSTFSVDQCKAGEYIGITTGTPQTDNGTAVNTGTLNGTVAFFIDYIPTFDIDGKHDV